MEALTPKADPRPAVERQVLPPGPQRFPALGLEFIRVFAVEALEPMHRVDGVADHGAFGDENGRLAVHTATERDERVDDSSALVPWHDGIEAES